jgi:ABC-2 type transport system permease protein/lipopolysaccharide transport system permease protein
MLSPVSAVLKDFAKGVGLAPLWWRVGLDQTAARFQRSILGPFWMAANLLATAFALAFVFGGLLGNDIRSQFPHLMAGLLAWGLVGAGVADAANLFLHNANLMQTQRLPLSFYGFLHLHKALVNFLAQLISFWIVMLILGTLSVPHWSIIPSLLLVCVNVYFASLMLALPSTRFRDFGYMSGFVFQVLFFVTPIFWAASQMSPARRFIVTYNPFAHMVELLRAPLLGHAPDLLTWMWGGGTALVLGVSCIVTLMFVRKRVVFWL